VLVAFAEKVDFGDDQIGAVGAQVPDVGEQPMLADFKLDLASDLAGEGDARIGVDREIAKPLAFDLDLRSAARNLGDETDRLVLHRAWWRVGDYFLDGKLFDRLDLLIALKSMQIYEIGHDAAFP
jgi:hypothetical protein